LRKFSSQNMWPSRMAPRCIANALGFVGFSLILSSGDFAQAQVPAGLPGAVEPGRDLPAPMVPEQPRFNFSIVPAPASPVPAAADEIQFLLNDIMIVGANAISPETLRPLYDDMIGSQVTLSDIHEVASAIEEAYRLAGYILVRAVVPPQSVADGVFTLNVIEGFIANIVVEGGDAATQQIVRAYLQPVLNTQPIELVAMERALLLANDLPGANVSALLRPSPGTPGAADLLVEILQPTISGGLSLDNRGSRFSGIWSLTGDFAINSPFGGGDQITGRITTTSPVHRRFAADLQYRRPIGTDGAVVSAIGVLTRGEPGSSLSALDITSDSWAIGARFSQPIIRTRAKTLIFEAGVTFQDARLRVLDAPFSRDKWRVADIGLTYLSSEFLGGSLSAGLYLAQGLPGLGGTLRNSASWSRAGAAPDFTKLSGTIHYLAPLAGALNVLISGQAQYSFSQLMAGEEIVFGGTRIGRGYDPAAIAGDHGLGGSLELRYDHRLTNSAVQMLQPYLAFDAAQTWNRIAGGTTNQSLSSVGAGLRVYITDRFIWNVEIARTLDAVPGSDGGRRATKVLTDVSIRF
jgi:hemolysin activation/secretion protein